MEGLEKKRIMWLGIAGLISGICFLFKQSIGGLLIPGFILGIILVTDRKDTLKLILVYVLGCVTILIPVRIYFILQNAFGQALYYIFTIANSVKSHQASFLEHRLIVIPFIVVLLRMFWNLKTRVRFILVLLTMSAGIAYLLLGGNRIGRLVMYIFDPIFYVQTVAFLVPLILLSKTLGKNANLQKRLTLISVTYIVFYLAIAASGYSMGPAVIVAPFLIPIVIFISEKYKIRIIPTILIAFYKLTFAHNPYHLTDPAFGAFSAFS